MAQAGLPIITRNHFLNSGRLVMASSSDNEISMVENLHFERLNAVMKEARGDGRAFGGVQLIVTGDVSYLNVFWIKD
tara:strand:- start:25404 stop:25634 length:231 start_codon:yes stop_codon:yes gene_type:complete